MNITTHIAGLAARITGAGEPLMLLHGGMGSWNHWTRNIDALAGRFTLYLRDMPGYGDSPVVAKATPDDDYVALVAAAVAEIARQQPVRLAGFSFGAMIADPANISEEAIDLHLADVRRTNFDGRRMSLSERMLPTLARIPCPVQMIWGEGDVLPYPSVQARADAVRAARPDLRVDLTPGAGHRVQFEAPEAVNRAMLNFFGEVKT